jgi:hypothetical protein
MKRVAVAAATALLCLACGDGSSTNTSVPTPVSDKRAGSSENEAPRIQSAQVVPSTASAADSIAVEIHVDDPDNDRLTMTYEWYRNGELVPDQRDANVSAGTFARGDRIHAIVYVSDKTHQVSRETSEITLQNAAPRVDSVTLSPARPTGLDLIEAQVVAHDVDSDEFAYEYAWFKNGQPIPDATGPRLPPGTVKRGDQLSVQVAGNDGRDVGPATASAPITIQNSSPEITSTPNYELGASGHYSYDVAAKDPDGDQPLRYELLEAPPGMTVDVSEGRVTWTVPADAKGTYQVELAVSDGFGGKTLQHYALALDWNEAPANASEGGSSKPAAPAPAGDTKKPVKGKAAAAAKAKPTKVKPSDEDDTDQDQEREQSEETDEE